MKQATARKSHDYENNKQEEWSRWRRRDHDNIEAVQNLMIAEIIERRSAGMDEKERKLFEMSPKTRQLISAIQGAHGGGDVVNDEFERGYLGIGQQLHFTGNNDAIRSRVRNWINALLLWQNSCGFTLVTVKKGGAFLGTDDKGDPIYECSTFIDHLLPVADEAVQLARKSPTWAKHPGDALAEQIGAAVEKLPNFKPKPLPTPEDKPDKSGKVISLTEYQQEKENRFAEQLEQAVLQIEELDGDGVLWARRKLLSKLTATIDSLERTHGARRCWIMPDDEDGDVPPVTTLPPTEIDLAHAHFIEEEATTQGGDTTPPNATAYTCNFSAPEGFEETMIGEEGGGEKKHTPPPAETRENIEKNEPSMIEWALLWASRGIPVFPLHEVYDETCTCTCDDHWRKKEGKWTRICEGDTHVCGSECGNKGKHPRTDRKIGLQNGLKIASRDPSKITVWWQKYPAANIGGRMLGKVGIDVDTRHGGSTTLYDLCEKYGQEWLAGTWENTSGSGGPHFIFDNPTGVCFKNSAGKIGPGIDTRGDEGYLVMPPSLHVSGNRYAVKSPGEFSPLPQFIIDLLNKPKGEDAIEYQDSPKISSGIGWGEKFPDGCRNDGLLAYGIGRMRHAWERTEDEIYQQLSQVNQARCVPPLDDEEVRSLAAHIACDYGYLYGVKSLEKEAAA